MKNCKCPGCDPVADEQEQEIIRKRLISDTTSEYSLTNDPDTWNELVDLLAPIPPRFSLSYNKTGVLN